MKIYSKLISVPENIIDGIQLEDLKSIVSTQIPDHHQTVRFAVTEKSQSAYHCEIGVLEKTNYPAAQSIFDIRSRQDVETSEFNVVHMIPTGVGCELGGHVDGGASALLVGSLSDTLVTHPNVVNGADINEMPDNTFYVEGSILTKLMMGTVSLQKPRANRVLVISETHKEKFLNNTVVNSVNAARVSWGLNVSELVFVEPFEVKASFSQTGTASGEITNVEPLFKVVADRLDECDAVAITSPIRIEKQLRTKYYEDTNTSVAKVNPWGGVEAMLTHAMSLVFKLPAAHAPMEESMEFLSYDPGICDPRVSAEAVSLAYVQCVLKGLHRSPRICSHTSDGLGVERISALVTPEGLIGLPLLAACLQGIPVIAVRENRGVLNLDLTRLPWRKNQFYSVENYWEAIGVLQSLKCGIAPDSTRRPIGSVKVSGA